MDFGKPEIRPGFKIKIISSPKSLQSRKNHLLVNFNVKIFKTRLMIWGKSQEIDLVRMVLTFMGIDQFINGK